MRCGQIEYIPFSAKTDSRTIGGTGFALIAFAANSLLCRLALGHGAVDAATFTFVRLLSGAVALGLICFWRGKAGCQLLRPDFVGCTALFGYAAAFSLAYRDLTAGTGALLLFGAVQITMIGAALFRGERPAVLEWLGLLIALSGLGWLIAPGVSAPSPRGALLMIMAGAAWGIYSLRGRRSGDPLSATTANFIWSVILGLLLLLLSPGPGQYSTTGIGWAVLSGALASGLGYAVWYAVLPRLTAVRAATMQLTVPVLAAFGGFLFLKETLSARLIIASVLVLGGVGLAILGRRRS